MTFVTRALARLLLPVLGMALVVLVVLPGPGKAQEKGKRAKEEEGKVVAIAAARIETIARGPIRDGVIIVRDGKIAEVGRGLPIPEGAELIDAGEGTVIPGLVVPVSRIGLSPPGRSPSRTPHFRSLDELDAYRSTYERLLAGGVTTINLAPGGRGLTGQSVAIRARRGGRDAVALRESSALLMSIEPSTGAKSAFKGELERGKKAIEARKKKEAETKKKEAEAKKKDGEKKGTSGKSAPKKDADKERPKPDPKTQPLVDVLEGKLPLLISCRTPAAAAHLLPILEPFRKEPFQTRAAIITDGGIHEAGDLIREKGVPVILRAQISYERNTRNRICPPGMLASAGVEVALLPASDSEGGFQTYLYAAAQMIKHGMRRDDLLRSMTLTPAKILGLERRVGSIEPGKDANLVVLNGDPFHGTTRIEKVLLEGRVVYRFGERPDTSSLVDEEAREKAETSEKEAPKRAAPKVTSKKKDDEKEKPKEEAKKEEKEPAVAIVGGDIYTISNGVVRRGTIIVRDGKIDSVGSDLPVPEGARVIDAKGQVVLPGFVAVSSSRVGVSHRGAFSGKLADALDPYAFSVTLALAAGITSLYTEGGRRRGSDLVQGTSAVIKMTRGDLEGMLVREPAAVTIRYSGASPSAKFALKERLRKAVKHARKLKEAEAKGKEGKPPRRDPGSEALIPLLRREVPARISANKADDLLAALELADEFGIRLVLEGAHESWTVAEEISKRDASLIIVPRQKVYSDKTRKRPSGSNLRTPGILRKAGVPFSILPPQSRLSTGGIVGQDLLTLPLDAAFAVGRGLDEESALEAITLNAAKALGVETRVGSIEPGKDADIIILDGHPLDFRTFVTLTMVNGKVLYEKNKNPLFAPFGRHPAKEGD